MVKTLKSWIEWVEHRKSLGPNAEQLTERDLRAIAAMRDFGHRRETGQLDNLPHFKPHQKPPRQKK